MDNNNVESYIFSITLYIITLLALIGGIHLIYNMCGKYMDPHSERSGASKTLRFICVSTVIFFLLFLFSGCIINTVYQSSIQCQILFCMIGFYIYGKMLLYVYFVLRAYIMLKGSSINYEKRTVILILSIYFVMMNSILCSMLYIHFTADYCSISGDLSQNPDIQRQRTIVFGVGAVIDGSMAILSVSLLIQKLFALVRKSMDVHGGISKITPRPSPRNSIIHIHPIGRPPSRSLPLPPAHTHTPSTGAPHSKLSTHNLQRLGSTSYSTTVTAMTAWTRQNSLSSPYPTRYQRNMNHIHPYPVHPVHSLHTNGFHKSFSEHTLKTTLHNDAGEELSKSSNRSNRSNHSNPSKLHNAMNVMNGKEVNLGTHPHHKTTKKQLRFIGVDDIDKRRSASADLESMIEKLSRHKQFKMRTSRRKTLSTTNTNTNTANTTTDSAEDSCQSAASVPSSIHNDAPLTTRSITPEAINHNEVHEVNGHESMDGMNGDKVVNESGDKLDKLQSQLTHSTPNSDDEEREHSPLQSILSQESLEDADIDKVKKMSIGHLLPTDLARLRVNTDHTTDDADAEEEEEEEEDDNEGFSMINESDNDENVPINPLSASTDGAGSVKVDIRCPNTPIDHEASTDRALPPHQLSHPLSCDTPLAQQDEDKLDDDDDGEEDSEEEDEDDMKEISPFKPKSSREHQHREHHHHSRYHYKPEMSDTRMTLQIPSNLQAGALHEDRSLSAPPELNGFHHSRSLSPRQSFVSLSRRSSSIFQMLTNQRASQIASGISKEHIHKFHSVTHHDNEILLLSTKLLILLTVCVISSFCSFLILFGIFRVNQNNGIFFVYGIDSFINIWCLAFTFKFSTKLYDLLFNCGNRHRSTKFCFPMVKTVALTWKVNKLCVCCNDEKRLTVNVHSTSVHSRSVHSNSSSTTSGGSNKYENHLTSEAATMSSAVNSSTAAMEEREETQCRMSCFFCCGWGDEEVIQVYHMAKGEVELMLYEEAQNGES